MNRRNVVSRKRTVRIVPQWRSQGQTKRCGRPEEASNFAPPQADTSFSVGQGWRNFCGGVPKLRLVFGEILLVVETWVPPPPPPMARQHLGGQGLLIFWGFAITHFRHATLGRTPLDEWPARRRDLYLTTHNTQKRQITMLPVGFEPAIPASVDSRLRPRGQWDR
jgi:hypothetical protein